MQAYPVAENVGCYSVNLASVHSLTSISQIATNVCTHDLYSVVPQKFIDLHFIFEIFNFKTLINIMDT